LVRKVSRPDSFSSLVEQLSVDQGDLPVHAWQPDYCGEIDIRIHRDGTWSYRDSPIGRSRLVRLLSTVLRLDSDGEYYLVTPSEKLRVRVDDAPFVAIEVELHGSGEGQDLVFRTNVGDIVSAGVDHPIRVSENQQTGEPSPYVMIRHGLEAIISRSVFYELVDLSVKQKTDQEVVLGVWSNHVFFKLGLV